VRAGAALRSARLTPATGKACVVWESDTLQVVVTVFYVGI